LSGAIGLNVLAFAACDEVQGPPSNRYYIAPDADEVPDPTRPDPVANGDGGLTDAAVDGDAALQAGPADLALTGWWRASYASGAWLGTASAGTSGTNVLTEAVSAPATGAAVNGLLPAAFDGANDRLANPTTIGTLLSASAWSAAALVWVDAVSTTPVGGYTEIVADSRGFWSIGTWNNGTPRAVVTQYNAGQKYVDTAITLGAWNLVQAKLEGGSLRIRVNNGAWTTTVAGNIGVVTGTLIVGRNYSSSQFFRGKMLELMLAGTALPDPTFDRIRSYLSARYGLTTL